MSVTRRWRLWFPVLIVGSVLYWTAALSLGTASLVLFTDAAPDVEGPIPSPEPIVVDVQPSPWPEEAADDECFLGEEAVSVELRQESPRPDEPDEIGRTAY